LDFDGTVTNKDIGDEVCDRFAPPAWRDIDAQWVRNELSLPEAQRRMWGLARCAPDEARAYAVSVGALRPGLDALVAAATASGALWLASGGFDFYIEALLDSRLAKFERAFYNRARFVDGKIAVEFPHDGLACGRCAVCKGKVCDQARAIADRVVFIGDGASDRCAIGRADLLCAVRGSLLARACDERGVAYHAFERLDDLCALVSERTPPSSTPASSRT
jgi:2,3-diketo-5-methylthio-1-phosphopentane phosphatase